MMLSVDRYIPACKVPEYDEYCPLIREWGVLSDDGRFQFNWDGEDREINASEVIANAGYLVLEIGSVEEEYTVSTAANAVYESLRALFSACHDIVRYERIRTSVELSEYLKMYRCNYSHIILIGHGGQDGIKFLDKSGPIRGNELAGLFGADAHKNSIQIISLCCHSGCEENARSLSNAENVTEVLAPEGTFDLRWAVYFILGYFLSMYLRDRNVNDAVCDAALDKTSTPMCVWKNGEKVYRCES